MFKVYTFKEAITKMRTSYSQFETIVNFMEQHGDLSKATAHDNRITNLNLWAELVSLLNSDGSGSQKIGPKWRKVWSDFKNNTKRKALRCQAAGSNSTVSLSELEQRVLNIMGAKETVDFETESPIPSPSSDDWNLPSTSIQSPRSGDPLVEEATIISPPVIKKSPSASQSPSTSPVPIMVRAHTSEFVQRRKLTANRRHEKPIIICKKIRSNTNSQLDRMVLLKSDKEWREYQKEKERRAYNLEMEKLRLREIELQQQRKNQELISQFLSIVSNIADNYFRK